MPGGAGSLTDARCAIHVGVGLGDQIYARPFVLRLAETRDVWIPTPWPELFHGKPSVHRIASHHGLRTQRANVERAAGVAWERLPPNLHTVNLDYGRAVMTFGVSIYEALVRQAGVGEPDFGLDVPEAWMEDARAALAPLGGRPFCLYRPPTVRREWAATGRNPSPSAIREGWEAAQELGLAVVAVGWLAEGDEALADGALPGQPDLAFLCGELSWTAIAGAMVLADLVLYSPSFFLPLSVAVRSRSFCLYGGMAPPSQLVDPRMGLERHGWAAPDPFCSCWKLEHGCNKFIPQGVVRAGIRSLFR